MKLKFIKNIARLLPLVPFSIFSFYVLSNFQNFPNGDDFDSFLDFLNRFVTSESWFQSLALLFERHSQHFRTPDRLTALLLYALTGSMNFYFFSFLGLAGLVLTFYLIIYYKRDSSLAITPLLASLLFFQPSYVEATQWANTCIQFIWINVFVLMSFISYRKRPLLTLLFSVLAILTQGNGICVLPSIILMMVYRREFNKTLFFYVFTCIATLVLFNVRSLEATANKLDLVSEMYFAFEMLGSSLWFYKQPYALVTGGILSLISALFFIKSGANICRKNQNTGKGHSHSENTLEKDYLVLFLVFLVASCFATAHFRIHLDPKSSYTTSRYTLLSVLSIITILRLSADYFSIKSAFKNIKLVTVFLYAVFLVAPAMLFNLHSYKIFKDQYYLRRDIIQDSMTRWHIFKQGLLYSPELRAKQILEQSIQLGIFHPETPNSIISEPYTHTISKSDDKKIQAIWSIEHSLCNEEFLLIDGWVVEKKSNAEFQDIILTYGEQSFHGKSRFRPDVNLLLAKSPLKVTSRESGFFFLVPRHEMKEESVVTITVFNQNDRWSQRNIALDVICKNE